jgi:hypothetical protein
MIGTRLHRPFDCAITAAGISAKSSYRALRAVFRLLRVAKRMQFARSKKGLAGGGADGSRFAPPKSDESHLRLIVPLSPALDAAAAEPKRVLMLFSFGREFKPWSEYARAIRTERQYHKPLRLSWRVATGGKGRFARRDRHPQPQCGFVSWPSELLDCG